MNRHPQSKSWFFPIGEAPVLSTVTRNGKVRDVRVPHKKALVAADVENFQGIPRSWLVTGNDLENG